MRLYIILFLLICININAHSVEVFPVNVLTLGMKDDSQDDQSKLLQEILDKYESIYIPGGTYFLSKISIPSNRNIFTDGYDTKFVQIGKMKNYEYMIRIQGTHNIFIQKFSAEGTFKTEPDKKSEMLSLVNIRGGSRNIVLEGIKGQNVWGDVLLITGNPKIRSRNPTNINVEEVYASNCYRNGVSVLGGLDIKFGRVFTEKCGLSGFDIEAESAIVEGFYLQYFNGGAFRVTGKNPGSINKIEIDTLIADGDKVLGISQNYRLYSDGSDKELHGVILTGKEIKIKYAHIVNFPGAALMVIRKIPTDNIEIDFLEIENCCLKFLHSGKGVPYYIINNNKHPSLIIGTLNATLPFNPGRIRAVRDKTNIVVSNSIK